jgi:hypothetical protein
MPRDTVATLSTKFDMMEKAIEEVKSDVKAISDKLDRNFEKFARDLEAMDEKNEKKYA